MTGSLRKSAHPLVDISLAFRRSCVKSIKKRSANKSDRYLEVPMTSIDHVDLNLLRVFHAIVEERSLTKAGERLALSQPAVSYSLGRLRTLFDDPLFVRTRAGMQPTPV